MQNENLRLQTPRKFLRRWYCFLWLVPFFEKKGTQRNFENMAGWHLCASAAAGQILRQRPAESAQDDTAEDEFLGDGSGRQEYVVIPRSAAPSACHSEERGALRLSFRGALRRGILPRRSGSVSQSKPLHSVGSADSGTKQNPNDRFLWAPFFSKKGAVPMHPKAPLHGGFHNNLYVAYRLRGTLRVRSHSKNTAMAMVARNTAAYSR